MARFAGKGGGQGIICIEFMSESDIIHGGINSIIDMVTKTTTDIRNSPEEKEKEEAKGEKRKEGKEGHEKKEEMKTQLSILIK